jgi:hypothetical protein
LLKTSAIGLLVAKKSCDMEITLTIMNFYDYSSFFHPLLNECDVKTSFFLNFETWQKQFKKWKNRKFMDFFQHFKK